MVEHHGTRTARPWIARALGIAGSIPTIGLNVPLSSLIAPLTFPLKRTTERPPLFRLVVIWSVIGTAAFVLSALLNRVEPSSSSIGQFTTLAITLISYRICIVDSANAARVVAWLAGTMIIYYVTLGPANTQGSFENLWKYGIAYPLTFLIVYLIGLRAETRVPSVLALGILGGAGMLLGYRSHGLVCMAAALIIVAKGRRARSMFGLFIVGGAGLIALSMTIPNLLLSGVFGESVRQRTLIQSENGPLLLGGRTESPLSIATIARHPWFGIGNSQSITTDDINAGAALAQSLGMTDPGAYLPFWIREEGRISLHSVLLNSWVEGGVLASIMPILLLAIFIWGIGSASGRFAPLIIVASMQGAWDLLFSPWASNKSVVLAATAFLCMMAILDHQRGSRVTARTSKRLATRLRAYRRQLSFGHSQREFH